LGEKKKAYARSGIPEYWVVDIPHEAVHVFHGANHFAETYITERQYAVDATIAPSEFPDVAIPVAQILGVDET
jgi:Uma2 family endonuclease